MLRGGVSRPAAGRGSRDVPLSGAGGERRQTAASVGERIALVLRGAWRHEPDVLHVSAGDLAQCVDTLIRSGAGAIVWQRLRRTDWWQDPAFHPFRDAHQIERLRAELNTRYVAQAVAEMQDAGIDAILLKGWSVAVLYADPALRPLGDIDLLVRERDGDRARQLAAALSVHRPHIDLHTSLLDLTDRTVPELFERSRMIPLGDVDVHVLGREDQFRHLCLHFFRHAGSRPLWLCDIAATLEAMSHDFDWEGCLGGDPRLSERVVAAVGLAQMLLDARAACPLPSRWSQCVPDWLPRAVLKSWGARFDPRIFRPTAMSLSLRDPGEILPALLRRWPNPLEATVERSAHLTGVWRPVVQLHEATVRAIRFLPRLAAGR